MTKARKHDSTSSPGADLPAPSETWLRVLAPSFERESTWQSRDPVNKAMFAISGAHTRLEGLANICWGLSIAERLNGGHLGAGAMKSYAFLAQTLEDLGRGLREVHQLYKLEMDKQATAALRASRRGGK